jgi:hypothetical protein
MGPTTSGADRSGLLDWRAHMGPTGADRPAAGAIGCNAPRHPLPSPATAAPGVGDLQNLLNPVVPSLNSTDRGLTEVSPRPLSPGLLPLIGDLRFPSRSCRWLPWRIDLCPSRVRPSGDGAEGSAFLRAAVAASGCAARTRCRVLSVHSRRASRQAAPRRRRNQSDAWHR